MLSAEWVGFALLMGGALIAFKTLPPRTAAQLKQFLADSSGGKLVIAGNGDLRLEH